MIDVAILKARLATRSGDVQVKNGIARLTGDSGTLTFVHVQPSKLTLWKSAELIGISDPSTDAVRVRLSDGTDQFYIDANLQLQPVTDTDTWDAEYSQPYRLAVLNVWTRKSLQFIVHMIPTAADPIPAVSNIYVLVDHPTWEGIVSSTVRGIATFVGTVQPVFIHSETLTAPRSSWKVGAPWSEHQYEVSELVQVAVDNIHKSATLANGEITLEGPPAPTGSFVELAFKVQPPVSVRRTSEISKVHRTPAWFCHELVAEGGLTGIMTEFMIGGESVKQRLVELRVRVNGVGHRQADVLAMRLALQTDFANGLEVGMPIGRCVFAQLDGLVEVVEEGPLSLPMATGSIIVNVYEYIHSSTVRRQTDDSGTPITTEITLELPDGSAVIMNENGFTPL